MAPGIAAHAVRLLFLGAAVAFLAASCMPLTPGASVAVPEVSQPPLSPAVSGTAAALEAAFRPTNLGFVPAIRSYRPAEPLELQGASRTVFQVALPADPESGFFVIYEFPDASHATDAGAAFARYLESGFGQTNYPVDTKFALGIEGSTMVFAAWSPGAMSDWAAAAPAFQVLSTFGQPITIVR